jgi:transcriptional regulator with XRE-family HTH domain
MGSTEVRNERAELVARNMRDRREQHGLTQQQLACRLDITQQEVSRWENGVWEPRARLTDIAAALDCHWTDFYRRRDEA